MELTNSAGCLTEAGLRAVAEAVPGSAPPELAAHLAACVRCQRRLLGVDRKPLPASSTRRPPSAMRFALALLGVMLALAAVLWTTRLLLG